MRKSITIRLGERTYDLMTDANEEELINILNRLQTQYSQLKNSVQDAEIDEILLVMLANALLDQVRYEKTISQLVTKLSQFVDRKEGKTS
ncbi:hypothetical protein [Thermotoga profunda]|uniref:hypothetical protein n=1 Tax=Thermotoga profunda TaxID=1508420 RepID=UPI0014944B3E|nr:hypothetical protein [Thermotoga profunda]